MTCKDCIHHDICYVIYAAGKFQSGAELCKNFKNKADFVEVKHGEWEQEGDDIFCSECGKGWNMIDNCTETFDYCPKCGAKMDGKQ